MGSFIEINDTLQISAEQGFPADILDIKRHVFEPYTLKDIGEEVFSFKGKSGIRLYHAPPVRSFLVQNLPKDGKDKWIYWGLAHILEITYDYVGKTTSGKYKVIHINTLEEMKQAFRLVDQRKELDYFSN